MGDYHEVKNPETLSCGEDYIIRSFFSKKLQPNIEDYILRVANSFKFVWIKQNITITNYCKSSTD